MTIIALLHHSLANLRLKAAKLQQQNARLSSERSYGFWPILTAARLQEAELLVNGYVPQPDNADAGEPIRQFNGWAHHR